MHALKHLRPSWFLTLFAIIGILLDSVIFLTDGPGVGAFLLISGVVIAALTYPRWVQHTAIVMFDLMLLPTLLHLEMDPVRFWSFMVGGTLVVIALAEAIYQLVGNYTRSVDREKQAQERLLELLEHNPAVVYELSPDRNSPAGLRVTFIGHNARELLGIDPTTHRFEPGSAGLAGRVSPEQAGEWRMQLEQHGFAVLEYPLVHADGRTLWVRDACRTVRERDGRLREIVGHLVDISEPRRIAGELAERERQLNEIVKNSPAVLFRAIPDPDRDHGWLFVFNSLNVCQVLGYTIDELKQDPDLWVRRIHPDDRARISEAARKASLDDGNNEPVVYDYRFVHRDGRTIWLQDTLRIVRDESGRPTEMFGQSLDITARRLAEEALSENRRQLDEVVRNSPALLYRAVPHADDPEGWQVLYTSANAEGVVGYATEEIAQNPRLWFERIHPDDLDRYTRSMLRSNLVPQASLAPFTLEYRYFHKDGALVWLQDSIRVIVDAASQPIELYGQTMNVTERKAMDQALAESRRIQDESVRNSPAILFRARPLPDSVEGWQFVYHSANTVDVLGYTVDELHADPGLWVDCIHPDDRERTFLTAANALATWRPLTRMPITYDYRFRHKAGQTIWIQNSLRILFDAEGRASELYGLSVDITGRYEAEQALQASRLELDEIVRNSPAALFRAVPDPDALDGLRYVYYSPNISEIVGLSVPDLENGVVDWIEHIHPDDRVPLLANCRAFALGMTPDAGPLVHTYRFLHGDGREIWLQDTLRAIRDEQGRSAR